MSSIVSASIKTYCPPLGDATKGNISSLLCLWGILDSLAHNPKRRLPFLAWVCVRWSMTICGILHMYEEKFLQSLHVCVYKNLSILN